MKRHYYEVNPSASVENKYDLPEWEHPQYYGGHSPIGDYLIYTRHRDSETLYNVNYESILESLNEAYEASGDENEDNQPYDFRAGHPMVGWVEYIIVPRGAPDSVLARAYEILGALADYPVLDDEKLSEAESEEASESWDNWARRDVESLIERETFGYIGTGADEIELELSDSGPLVELWVTDNGLPEHETHSDGAHFDVDEIAETIIEQVNVNPYSILTEFDDWFVWQVALTN